jgi:hypothetical protein
MSRSLKNPFKITYDHTFASRKELIVIIALTIFIIFVHSIVNYSSGEFPYTDGQTFISYDNNQRLWTAPCVYSTPTVNILMGYAPPANTLVLYCTYTITDSHQKTIYSALMLHYPFSSEYLISKTLTNLANGNYTFTIYSHLANGALEVPMNETFIIDTAFVEPKLTIISPQNQKTYDTNSVEITFNANSKMKWAYYSFDSGDYIRIMGNTTLNGLSNGSHILSVHVQTENSYRSINPITEQTVCFNIRK